MVNKTDDTLMYFVGDIAPYMEDAGSIFQHVAHILSQGDITFCQLEANLSHRGIRLPQVRATLRYDPKMAAARQWKCDAAILHLNCGCEVPPSTRCR